MKIKITQIIVIVLMLFPQVVKAQGNLIFNGGFDTSASGWTLTNSYWAPGNGSGGYIVLGSRISDTPTASQTIASLIPGTTYFVSGDCNRASKESSPDYSFGVAMDGVFLFETSDPGDFNWHSFNFLYTATSTDALLSLSAQRNGTGVSYNIDNIAMYPVPEPSAMSLIFLGGGVLLYVRRNKNSLGNQFTDFNGLSGMLNLAGGYSFQIQLRDCYVGPGHLSPNSPPGGSYSDGLTNNLFERATLDIGTFDYLCHVYFYNNTVINSTMQIDNDYAANGYRTIKDNLFDHSTVTVAYPSYVTYDHNAYFGGSTTLSPYHTGDFTLSALIYADGALGNRYIDSSTSPTLMDAGDRDSAAAGLSNYTIQADQTRDCDTVDIGFHYKVFAPLPIRSGFDENTLENGDDNSTTSPVDLPFTVNFLGTAYSSLYVNQNGNVTFNWPFDIGTWGTISFAPYLSLSDLSDEEGLDIIAPFWADVDTSPQCSALTTYGNGAVDGHAAFGVNWVNVGYYSGRTDKLNSFQLILIDRCDRASGDYDVEFNYTQIQWEEGDATSESDDGLSDENTYPARAGYASIHDQAFELSASGDVHALLDSNHTTGLIYNNFNSCLPGRYVFQFHGGAPIALP